MNHHAWRTITTKMAAEALQKYGHVLKWKDPNACVMDLGCAEGYITKTILYPYVKDRIDKLTGIDISQDFIESARQENSMRNIDYQVVDAMNAEDVEKLKSKFDVVFSFHVAQWILDQRTFTNGLHKMLKPNGQIFLRHIANAPIHKTFYRQFQEGTWSKYLPQKRVLLHYTDDPVGYISKIVEEVGFKIEICELEQKKKAVEDCPGFITDLIRLYPDLKRIPDELQEDYFRDQIQYCLQQCTYLKEPNVYEWPYEMLTCIASK